MDSAFARVLFSRFSRDSKRLDLYIALLQALQHDLKVANL